MRPTLAFDVYGTLINPLGIVETLQLYVAEQALTLATLWREKQLEYTFRYGLMHNYHDFSVCTRQALDYCCDVLALDLPDANRETLMQHYQKLPAFADVASGLALLLQNQYHLYAFSNGLAGQVKGVLKHAGLLDYFDAVISVDDVRSFKPDPAVYAHFLHQSGADAQSTWLVSSNSFDVIGAHHAGWHVAWLKRDKHAVFDPWQVVPNIVATNLLGLHEQLEKYTSVD